MSLTVNGKVFNGLTLEQVEYLKENYTKRITDLESELNLCGESIKRILKALGIKRERLWKRTIPDTEEAWNDLKNPYISHVKLAKKYGCTETAVASMRKRHGFGVRRVGLTQLEESIADILKKLDIAYHVQYRIDKWSLDFYLGHKICIDIHGNWSHSKDLQIDRDIRKVEWMRSNGYFYLVIKEDDLLDLKSVIEIINDFFWASLHSNMQSTNRVNCWNPTVYDYGNQQPSMQN